MPKLNWKTKGETNPSGKPRVYFCCHPDDFSRYFQEISAEILKKQNCAVYYDNEPMGEIDEEEWLAYLGEMQLFIIPVTTRFLSSESRALNLEFQFAKERHIPVLPLMQENGLDELFAQKVGSLQYLNKYKKDETAIGYEEKLEKYLNSVLVGDELAAKVRSAFDAYIFLSYRKKDRVYAQELMRLIHKNEFCRDIAIWYDEFLTPGENFNDSIEEALKKSDLFALAVTPNLVNEENYVMNVEYPKAKKEGKTILPAEVVSTDKDELKRKYEGIPDCANTHNDDEFSEALQNSLKSIAVREKIGDPQHNFFIGLAYLSGIDVEVNSERAVKLITSAAKEGITEAMEKLVSMYRNGEGVEADAKKEIFWIKELIRKAKKRVLKKPDKKNLTALAVRYNELGKAQLTVNQLKKAKNAFRTSQRIVDYLYKIKHSYENLLLFSDNYEQLSSIYRLESNITKASKMSKKMPGIFDINNSEWVSDHDISIYLVNEIKNARVWLYDDRAPEIAERYYTEALTFLNNTDRVPVELKNSCFLMVYEGLAEINRINKQYSDAMEKIDASLMLQEQRVAEIQNMENQITLAKLYREKGNVFLDMAETENAEKYYFDAIELLEEIYKENFSFDVIFEIIKTKLLVSSICSKEDSRQILSEQLVLCRDAYEQSQRGQFCELLISILLKIGVLDFDEGNISQAEICWNEALTLAKKLYKKIADRYTKALLLEARLRVTDLSVAKGDYHFAKSEYKKIYKILENNYKQKIDLFLDDENRLELLCSVRLVDVYIALRNPLKSELFFAEHLKDDIPFTEEIKMTLRKTADLYCAHGDLVSKPELYKKPLHMLDACVDYVSAYDILNWLYSKTQDVDLLEKMREICYLIAFECEKRSNSSECGMVKYWNEKAQNIPSDDYREEFESIYDVCEFCSCEMKDRCITNEEPVSRKEHLFAWLKRVIVSYWYFIQ
ncbi:MAG: toll/interleukin-1 receptor domain-containing protein [Clostridia bacterium]|nr:toll/interleukin-1 receptor domain-containing protein [Clostridia bacterium]